MTMENWWKHVAPEHYYEMTADEWKRTPNDYKDVKPDGTKIVMHLNEHGATVLSPVRIVSDRRKAQ
jgi:hypothetical protein